MATIKVEIIAGRKRPTLKVKTYINDATALLDTGAYICMRFSSIDTFLSEFPEAKETGHVTYISGLGGINKKSCPVYDIPDFYFIDMNDINKRFILHNLPVAIYDTDKNYGYDMILGATILLQTDYAFINRKAVRYLQIDYDRDLYCKPKIAIDKKSGKPIYKNGHTIISGINTFFQDEDVSKENTLNIDKHPANIKSINESAKIQNI